MYQAKDIATYIIDYCIRRDTPITNLQLQQTLYILQQEHLRTFHRRLFADDFEIKTYFHYIPNVYYSYCHYGVMPITHNWKKTFIEPEDMPLINAVTDKIISTPLWNLFRLSAYKEEAI